jgi:hypothetical protein
LVSTKVVGSVDQFLNFGDYRGFSPYWPFQTTDAWLNKPGAAELTLGQKPVFPGVTTTLATASQSFGLGTDSSGKTGDFVVPFRESGIAMFDQTLNPLPGSGLPTGIGRFMNAVLRTAWTNFMNGSAPSIDKLATIEQVTFTNIYTTGLGDLVVALPRWNQCPLPDVDSIEAGPDYTLVEGDSVVANALDRQDYFHGREYVMSDFGIVSRRTSDSEEGKYDRVLAQGSLDFLTPPQEFIQTSGLLGSSLGTDEFQALFGDRTLTVNQAFPTDTDIPNLDQAQLLNNYCSAVKTMLMAKPKVLDITYRIPRPLELGRTVFLPDNCYLYYITGINRSWRIGEEYMESYHCEYGHPMWYHLPIPWVTRVNEIQPSINQAAATAIPPRVPTVAQTPSYNVAPGSAAAISGPAAPGNVVGIINSTPLSSTTVRVPGPTN